VVAVVLAAAAVSPVEAVALEAAAPLAAGRGSAMSLHKISHASEADHQLVTNAVAAAEQHTSGEIVTIVTDLSDHYEDVALAWASGVALLALAIYSLFPDFYLGLWLRLSGGWAHEYSAGDYARLVAIMVALKWLGTWLLLKIMPLRLALTPRSIKMRRVRALAVQLFKVGTESKTVGRTGVLLYLSMKEHRAEIVADEAIAGKVAPEIWGDAMISLIAEVKAGNVGVGMAEAVRQMGVVLAEHFPKGSDNPNELPDRLIEL
jgi:putative membrane protein